MPRKNNTMHNVDGICCPHAAPACGLPLPGFPDELLPDGAPTADAPLNTSWSENTTLAFDINSFKNAEDEPTRDGPRPLVDSWMIPERRWHRTSLGMEQSSSHSKRMSSRVQSSRYGASSPSWNNEGETGFWVRCKTLHCSSGPDLPVCEFSVKLQFKLLVWCTNAPDFM